MRLASQKYTNTICKQITIQIKTHPGQSFITEKDILHLLNPTNRISTLDAPLGQINSYNIQQQLLNQPLIKNVLVFKTWPNRVHIHVENKYMIGRLLNLHEPNDAPLYVDSDGNILSIETTPLLRLLVIGGNLENIIEWHGKRQICVSGLLNLLHYLYSDPFFCHQITSLQIENNHKIILGTQIGNHKIEFGTTENMHSKFEKLRLFYSQVIPYKGWNAYHRVNVEFANQLICE